MRRRWAVAGFVVLLGCTTLGARPASTEAKRPASPRKEARPSALPETCPLTAPRAVVIDKSARALGLYVDGRRVAAYPVGLGRHPEGAKLRQGDRRTPEGEYYICTRNGRSRFHLFLGLSYPGVQDADRAREEGLISARQTTAITEAIEAGSQPPWNTPLGGAIGIHGCGAQGDWTLGCIALDNEAMDELWDVLKLGDPVLIVP
ncbi:MAG: L,D-transpeptidase family protein [Armatimonadetes bacterium]|nr:L,D-transpeptidase family protein [Armatimonadota bacterium]